MKFEEVLPALREGKNITNAWIKNRGYEYVFYRDGSILNDEGDRCLLTDEELVESDDWEIVEEKRKSALTFKELTESLAYVKVIWNGKVVYDDEFGEGTPEDLENFQIEYNGKVVYGGKFEITGFHHIILDIEGED